MYQQVQDESKYQERRTAIETFNKENKWRKRGLALIPTKFGISFTALWLNQAGALVHIYHDGSVLLAHGGTEMVSHSFTAIDTRVQRFHWGGP